MKNSYGQPITSPEYFDGEHVANPMAAGLPPVCACGWTPHSEFTMADHLADMELRDWPRVNDGTYLKIPR